MGRDKALLSHPEGGTWLSRTLLLLAQLDVPITLLSRWPDHLSRASALRVAGLETWTEPSPHEGPLLALHRLMQHHSEQRLLICPIDMPQLTLAALHTLLTTAAQHPGVTCVAHDGQRCQPLLGIYPNTAPLRAQLNRLIDRGERRLQTWLEQLPLQTVPLDPAAIQNINHAAELAVTGAQKAQG